tara:strand:+ start:1149 stop:1418 length:270 start_codon:yes stop_codon:yes gene_type:complete
MELKPTSKRADLFAALMETKTEVRLLKEELAANTKAAKLISADQYKQDFLYRCERHVNETMALSKDIKKGFKWLKENLALLKSFSLGAE